MKKELTITIQGSTNIGKSRVSYIIKQYLKSLGFDVTHKIDTDHPSEKNFDTLCESNIQDAIESIKEKTTIVIEELKTRNNVVQNY